MDKLKVSLMYAEALRRLRDAEILSEAVPFDERSDSAYLLKLLGFELLIKLVYELVLRKNPANTHNFHRLYRELPGDLQGCGCQGATVLFAVRSRMQVGR